MAHVNTAAGRLQQRFNLLPEPAVGSNSSIDDELIGAITMNPDIELVLNVDPDSVTDPTWIYRKVVSGLSIALFEAEDIRKIVSIYVRGKTWEQWSDSERAQFICGILQDKEEKEADKARDIEELERALDSVTGRRSRDTEREREERKQINDILSSISKVEILTGIVDSDPGSWRIHIGNIVFEIHAGKIKTYNEFETMYLSNFGNYLPGILTAAPRGVLETPWRAFVTTLYKRAEKIAPEDSTAMIELGVILDILSGYRVTTDTTEWDRGSNLLLDHGDYYLLASSRMTQLLQDNNIKTDAGSLGKIMTRRGLKRAGNPAKRITGRKTPVKAWWIYKTVIDGDENTNQGDEEVLKSDLLGEGLQTDQIPSEPVKMDEDEEDLEERVPEKENMILVRILKTVSPFVGIDGQTYTVNENDILELPAVNANAMIKRKLAEPVSEEGGETE